MRADDKAYIEAKDSTTFCQFGQKDLSQTEPRSGIQKREFFHLEETLVMDRSREVMKPVTNLGFT